jgi:hypothetical protein
MSYERLEIGTKMSRQIMRQKSPLLLILCGYVAPRIKSNPTILTDK